MSVTRTKTKSRARVRNVPAGYVKVCWYCGERIKPNWKERPKQVICNIYRGRRWHSVEHWHPGCYEAAGEPYGEAE